jgi:hypothetical protein
MAEADRLAAADLWPGFAPQSTPVAIFDGDRTYLFRHPAPPEGFQPVPERAGVWVFEGRHPSVAANTSVDLAGTQTATLMPDARNASVTERASVLVHELFHVFQRERHPAWRANEAELFTYPVDDPALLAFRRMESAALRRALSADTRERAACWAHAALALRQERFAALPAASAAYERGTELNEGLAAYVQGRAGGSYTEPLPASEFAPEAVRQRGYAAGAALALLLDRLSPEWRHTLEQNDSSTLESLLGAALDRRAESSAGCTLPAAEQEAIRSTAAADATSLSQRRSEARRTFLEQPGWRLVITAQGAPLSLQGFDPINVQVVRPGEVLHTRFLKLGNRGGSMEVIGRSSLSEAAGAHPLFNGVRTLTGAGLASEPGISEAEGTLTIEADGVRAEFRGATLVRSGQTVVVRLAN